LLLNAAIISNEARTLWGTPGWLPDEIGVILDKGLFFCFEGDDLKLHLQRGNHNIVVYSLIGLAAEINGGQNMKPNLVSLINGW
jgi:PAB-dependent poly(A)-specific ribonuclease subunit 2